MPKLLAEDDVDDKVDGGIDDGEEIDRLTGESVEGRVVLHKIYLIFKIRNVNCSISFNRNVCYNISTWVSRISKELEEGQKNNVVWSVTARTQEAYSFSTRPSQISKTLIQKTSVSQVSNAMKTRKPAHLKQCLSHYLLQEREHESPQITHEKDADDNDQDDRCFLWLLLELRSTAHPDVTTASDFDR